MNKEVCKACRKKQGMKWDGHDERRWNYGNLFCRTPDYPGGFYSMREPGCKITGKTLASNFCVYKMEHLVLSQEEI